MRSPQHHDPVSLLFGVRTTGALLMAPGSRSSDDHGRPWVCYYTLRHGGVLMATKRKRRVSSLTLSPTGDAVIAAICSDTDLSRPEVVDGLLCRAAVRCGVAGADALDPRSQHAVAQVLRWLQAHDREVTG